MYATEQPRQSKRGMIAKLGAVPRAARLAARNTLDYVGSDGKRRIRLHSTDILTFDKRGGGFTINTGGWNSVTTRARLNDFLPSGYRVWTSAGRIHLNGVPFHTRVRVTGSGVIRPDVRESTLAKMTRELDEVLSRFRNGIRYDDTPAAPSLMDEAREVILWLLRHGDFRLDNRSIQRADGSRVTVNDMNNGLDSARALLAKLGG